MPELPEVQNIVEDLRPKVRGKAICGAKIISCRRSGDEYRRLDLLNKNTILNVSRKGKCIIFMLGHGFKLLFHLGMTGQLLFRQDGRTDSLDPHTRVIFTLDEGSQLLFNDTRRFGWIEVLVPEAEAASYLGRLGEDALNVDVKTFKTEIRSRKSVIKAALLDQSIISGIGNIYADESLFVAGISPVRRANTLTDAELEQLHKAIREVLKKAIAHGGSTIRDYKLPDGSSGSFQDLHKVYQRAGKPCGQCGSEIVRIRVAGRGTCFCPKCQD